MADDRRIIFSSYIIPKEAGYTEESVGTRWHVLQVDSEGTTVSKTLGGKGVVTDLSATQWGDDWTSFAHGDMFWEDWTAGSTAPELMTNSGNTDTTDWIDTNADGLADGWVEEYGNETTSIVTGNGFTGNAQRLVGTVGHRGLVKESILTNGLNYQVSFKYRSDNDGGSIFLVAGGQTWKTLSNNTGDAIEYSFTGIPPTMSGGDFMFYISDTSGTVNQFIEVDEVKVAQITGGTWDDTRDYWDGEADVGISTPIPLTNDPIAVDLDIAFVYIKNTGSTNDLSVSIDGSSTFPILIPAGGSVHFRGGDAAFDCDEVTMKAVGGSTTAEFIIANK